MPSPASSSRATSLSTSSDASSGSSPPLFRHASDYESCEELDDLREECRDLVTRKNSLEDEIEGYKGEIRTLRAQASKDSGVAVVEDKKIVQLERLEFSLRNQLKEWENKYHSLWTSNALLLEEKCELEEAENDSRLNAQRYYYKKIHNVNTVKRLSV